MPSPFNNPETPTVEKTLAVGAQPSDAVVVSESILTCEECFADSSDGIYYPNKEWLVFDCVHCNHVNIVKGIKI